MTCQGIWDKSESIVFVQRFLFTSFFLHFKQEFISEQVRCPILLFINLIIGIYWHCVCLPVKQRRKRERKKRQTENEDDILRNGKKPLFEFCRIPKLLSLSLSLSFRSSNWTIAMSVTFGFQLFTCSFCLINIRKQRDGELLISLNEHNNNIWCPSSDMYIKRCRRTNAQTVGQKEAQQWYACKLDLSLTTDE